MSEEGITLELGDIIEIQAPSNVDINEMTALIIYIDNDKIKILDVVTGNQKILNINESGQFTDETIQQISLLSRSDVPGYARQNGLVTGTWIDIHFGGEVPAIITGEITDLDEDMIEITTFPQFKPIYIDFGYKGIPENIPIKTIVIRSKPESLKKVGSIALAKEGEDIELPEENLADIEFTPTGESITTIPDNVVPDANIREKLHDMYINANAIIFGEELEEITQFVEIPESKRRYSIEVQVNDMMDELLSTIPNNRRTTAVLNNIHLLIERFTELRSQFSNFDENANVVNAKTVGAYYKPLVERIEKLDTNLRWIIPVVTNRRKIYDLQTDLTETKDIVQEKSGDGLNNIESMQNEYYKKNNRIDYSIMNNVVHTVMTPFESSSGSSDLLTRKPIMTNIDTVIDTLGDFYSTVINGAKRKSKRSEFDSSSRRFVIQRYNLGLQKMQETVLRSGKTIYHRTPMTPNDTIEIKSLLVLPESVMKYSRIGLPGTSILEKSTLHEHPFFPFRLLRQKTDVIPNVIDDLTKEFDYKKQIAETGREFLTGIQEFSIDPNLFAEKQTDDLFHPFLESMVPKTRTLIQMIGKYMKDKISFLDVVKWMEPFMVYSQDITYKQEDDIRKFIMGKIKELNIQVGTRKKQFGIIRNIHYNINPEMNRISRLLTENPEFGESFAKQWSDKIFASESLYRMIELDHGHLFMNMITSIMISLMAPNNLGAEPNIDDSTDFAKIKANECGKRYLTKRYSSLAQLQKDNDTEEVFYDSEFDDTPYDILAKYKSEQKTMMPELFVQFLAENLIQKHDCPKHLATHLAKTLVAKKKQVSTGEFAILEIRPKLPGQVLEKDRAAIEAEAEIRKKIQYYRRVNDHWVKDNDIGDEMFIDTNELFCNISNKCFKNTQNAVCESLDATAERMKQIARKRMASEFDRRYAISIDELEQVLEKNINYYSKLAAKLSHLRDIQLYKANNLAFTIGSMVSINDIITSPHLKLRDLIMGQDDFAKKQHDLCQFYDYYCRNPMVETMGEDAHWAYCKDTNTKLLPLSIHSLAVAFARGGDYTRRLAEVCREVGQKSDDSDSIVDKYSGFMLCKDDFRSEEGVDFGQHISSHEILEQDLGLVELEQMGKKEMRVFENELTETIYRIFSFICSNLNISGEGMDDFVLRTSTEFISKLLISEEKYVAKALEAAKKQNAKPIDPYEMYRNETIILIVTSVIFIAIQTSIPSLHTKKSFPGCVRSFSGYPMNGIEDITGIQYIACILNKTKSSISPWNSIRKFNVSKLTDRIKGTIERMIKRADINDLYIQKREYILLNPDLVTPQEHSISRWLHFLPPVVPFDVISNLRNVSSEFHSEFKDLIRKGHKDQETYYSTFKSKLIQHGYGIIESINFIVHNKELLLKTAANMPFLENACCIDNETNPMLYFKKEDPNLGKLIDQARSIGQVLQGVNQLNKAAMMYHPKPTGIQHPPLATGFLEDIYYAVIIHYCQFDSIAHLPVPEEYKVICSERPEGYNRLWSIEEKVQFLKTHGKRFTVEDMHRLMHLVRQPNLLHIAPVVPLQQVTIMNDILEALDNENSMVIESILRDHLHKVIREYRPKVMMDEASESLNGLKNYLITTNDMTYHKIMDFLQKYGNLKPVEYEKWSAFLFNIHKWQSELDQASLDKHLSGPLDNLTGGLSNKHYDESLFKITQFIQNAVQSMSKVYPSILLSESVFYKNVPQHWGISYEHENDVRKFIQHYYAEIESFKSDKSTIQHVLQEVSKRLVNLNMFTQHIPVRTPITSLDDSGEKHIFHSIFDKQTIYLLFVYCFYAVINEYIEASDDPDLLETDVQMLKQTRRDIIAKQSDPSQLKTIDELFDEAFDDEVDERQEIEIRMGNQEDLKHRVGALIIAFLNVEFENKAAIDFSYDQIIERVRRTRSKEKDSITSYLEVMTPEERKLEEEFKKYKIGRWNVGMQKGLVRYDANVYDRERGQMLDQLGEGGKTDVVDEMMLDIYELDAVDEAEADAEADAEAFGIQDLGEDYHDGDFYGDDDPDDWLD